MSEIRIRGDIEHWRTAMSCALLFAAAYPMADRGTGVRRCVVYAPNGYGRGPHVVCWWTKGGRLIAEVQRATPSEEAGC